ncbi:type 1 glutamine amidotransferase [Brevundimonas sp. 2R-24]|uniref:Type 1 glutamine amidotransferase n=1 Tax=Peiella sedimenti TaxID=3061083 RepID=A0ABT8SIR4_9CAUL|nr:type 1 glutamine amidotransferase [Caulobacteraceae bacterium XZ-24]
MDIAILETGLLPPELRDAWPGGYPAMMQALLAAPYRRFHTFNVQEAPPPDPTRFDAVCVMGSPSGVYDGDPWIERLMDWLREARGETALVGVCFGHQVMAHAFGGHVEKAAVGWGLGRHAYEIAHRPDWMADAPDRIASPCSHQDQVLVQPPGTRVLAHSAFTPFAALAYEDHPAISFQFHPEFEADYARALVEVRRSRGVDPRLVDAALDSLEHPNDRLMVGEWIGRFLDQSVSACTLAPAAYARG